MKEENLGTLWHPVTAGVALEKGEIKSDGAGTAVRLCVRNFLETPLVFCWVDSNSEPHHFRLIDPSRVAKENLVTKYDFIERASTGHAFLIATASKAACRNANEKKTLAGLKIVGGYRPEVASTKIHLLAIEDYDEDDEEERPSLWCCMGPHLRGSKRPQSLDEPTIAVQPGALDSTPIDTTAKKYVSETLGGWPVFVENDWDAGDDEIRELLERDLRYATKCLPPHAYDALKSKTPIWINKSLEYGPEACPIKGSGLCFHPGADWLKENGCHTEKCHSVELYCTKDYKRTSGHWGVGGVLIHELSHAYHYLCLPDAYENAEIKECFQLAMREGLYDCVRVHGPQGPEAKAYACTDQMEYWAELSAAFLGGTDGTKEYNKWFPFNRSQLQKHDPRAYELLRRLWKVEDK